MTKKGRRDIATWLRKQATMLMRKKLTNGTYRGNYWYLPLILVFMSGCSINEDFLNYTDNFVTAVEADYLSDTCNFSTEEREDRLTNIRLMRNNIEAARRMNNE